MMQAEAVSRGTETVFWAFVPGEPRPVQITHMFDDDGLETSDWDEAYSFVAGPLADGRWLSAPVSEYRVFDALREAH